MISYSKITLKGDDGSELSYLACGSPGEDEIEFSDRFRRFRALHPDAHEIGVEVQPYFCGSGELRRADPDHLALISASEGFSENFCHQALMLRSYKLSGMAA